MFEAGIDTTFALYTKGFPAHAQFRVAGPYTCQHLPWYLQGKEPPGCPRPSLEEWQAYQRASSFGFTARILLPLLQRHCAPLRRVDIEVPVPSRCAGPEKTMPLALFYEADADSALGGAMAEAWRDEQLALLNRFLSPGKVFVDVGAAGYGLLTVYAAAALRARVVTGAWIGPSAVTTASEHVFVVPKAPAAADWEAAGLFRSAALVRVDIQGGEQAILLDVLEACFLHRVPLYVAFHLPLWAPAGVTVQQVVQAARRRFPYVPLGTILAADPSASVLFV